VSRTLKRPMFRRGGTVNDGIMTGLTDRTEKANGDIVGRARELTPELASLLEEFTPQTKLPLGQFGLNLASGKFAGSGALQNIVGSAKDPYAQFTKADDARERAIKSGAVKLGISQAMKESAPSKQGMLASMKRAQIDLENKFGPDGYTRAQLVKLASEYNQQEMMGKGINPQRLKAGRKQILTEKEFMPNEQAIRQINFEFEVTPKILKETDKAVGGVMKIDKKGKYITRNKPPGVYVDIVNEKVFEFQPPDTFIPLPEYTALLRKT